ncbi:DNA replication and repair protein RecF [termite gut metagenome]|jgi:AAA15 family ATPase/GTPase|uniref:DNA replication and repair protein RecF n=1 Tax=termite gut metagenome TaxID=433724 RepID=A0A5J4QN27_9ZZZZ
MRIKELCIKNFRGISDMKIIPDPQINLIVGINGAGKSSILDAISYLFSWFTARMMNNLKGIGSVIPIDDIKHGTSGCFVSLKIDEAGLWSLARNKPYHAANEKYKTELKYMMDYILSVYNFDRIE